MENEKYENADLTSLLFLISKFWAHIEILRAESVAIKIGKDKRGQQLQNFINSLESRKVRIVDRITQRAIGEILISIRSEKLETIKFIEFVNLIENDAMAKRWLEPLVQIVSRTSHTNERQQLLQYGVIVHALIDTLDPEHISTRQRPSYPSKLSKKTWTGLNYRIFGHYLKCVEQTAKYLGPPKAGGPKKR